MGKEGYAATQGNWKWNYEYYKKEESEENWIYRFKLIEHMKLRGTEQKKDSIGDSERGILIDATILFQSLGDMRKKGTQIGVNIGAVEAKTLHLADGGGVYSPIL